jgi:branched-chain amino acid transport system ATP-binding protein
VSGRTLEGAGIVKRFGGLTAVDGMTVRVDPGEIVALIGPNGAGKTTLFQCLTGSEQADAGVVRLGGREITRLPPDARARLGIGRTFQRLAVFPTMSVADNLRVGAENRTHDGFVVRVGRLLVGMLGFPSVDDAGNDQIVRSTLTLLGLHELRDALAGSLPTGTLRLVELGRALCHQPEVLLLDEPASGLDTAETAELQQVIRSIAGNGTGVLLVEHDVDLVFDVADRVYAMAEGRLLTEGSPDEVRAHPAVLEAYLDTEAAR